MLSRKARTSLLKSLDKKTDYELRMIRNEANFRGSATANNRDALYTFLRIVRSKRLTVPKKELAKVRALYQEVAEETKKEERLERATTRILNGRYRALYHACPHCGYKHSGSPKSKKAK